MNARKLDRLTDVAIDVFMFAFRAVIIVVVVLGSILTLLSGTYTASDWFELVGAGLTQGSIYAMIALGYTMVYGILRMINFAHGEIFMAGLRRLLRACRPGPGGHAVQRGDPPHRHRHRHPCGDGRPVLIAVGVERVAYRPLRNSPTLVPLISAIGASLFLQYTFRGFFGSGIYAYPTRAFLKEPAPIPLLSMRWVDVLVVVASLAMMTGLYLFVMRSRTGTAIRAVSEDKGTAALMGIDANQAIVLTFVIGAAMAAAGGVLYASRSCRSPVHGLVPASRPSRQPSLAGSAMSRAPCLAAFSSAFEAIGPTLFLTGSTSRRPISSRTWSPSRCSSWSSCSGRRASW